jgi:hypothetical protein
MIVRRRALYVAIIISLMLLGLMVLAFWQLITLLTALVGAASTLPIKDQLTLVAGISTASVVIVGCLTFATTAINAVFTYQQASISTTVNTARWVQELNDHFYSDRFLRTRHGAVSFLATRRGLLLPCDQDLSPHSAEQELWRGLNRDLVDIFNYFDWIGYLTVEKIGQWTRKL